MILENTLREMLISAFGCKVERGKRALKYRAFRRLEMETELELRAMLTPTTLFHADFSDAGGAPSLDGFTIDNTGGEVPGLWHLSTGRGNQAGHTADDSMYFGAGETSVGGGSYAGEHTAGRITSPSVSIPAPAVLSFNYFLRAESDTEFDIPSVLISENGGAFTAQSIILNRDSQRFLVASLDLGPFIGDSIKVQFNFDTIDGYSNDNEGWYVDDVMVTSGTPCLQGTVFDDRNDNDILDSDPGLPDTRVFIDDNDNGVYDTDYDLLDEFNETPVPIPDETTVTSTIVVGGSPTELVRDVNVTLDITHTYDSDLDVFLIAPNGTRVELFSNVGKDLADFTSTTLDDEAPSSITSGTAPFTGTFRPEGSLAALDGIAVAGTWTLEITDDTPDDTGTLNAWSLQIGVAREFTNITSQAIPDVSTITSPITVSGTTGYIQDIDVQLNVSHFATRDLDIFLIAPNGVRVELVTDAAPDTGSNFAQTIFDDEAATAILDGSAPFTGRFRPEGLLTDLDGYSANGTWQLEVTDDATGFTGTLNSWSLSLTIGERTDVTDAFGNYDILVTDVGNTFRVRQLTPLGFFPTAPSTGMQVVTMAPEVSIVTGVNFANQRPDFRMISATGNGGTGISINYEITNGRIAPIYIDIFQSSDGVLDESDTLVTTLFPAPADLTVGFHTVNLTLGVDIFLPGAGVIDLNSDYCLLFSADASNSVDEPDIDPLNEDNTVTFTGVYHESGGPVMAFGTDTADTFAVAPNGLNVEFDFDNASIINPLQYSYPIAEVTQFRLRGAGGDDNFTSGANNDTMSIPLAIWGGDGLDTIQGGDGNDSLFGGADNDLYVFFPSELVESDTVEEDLGGGRDTIDFSQFSTAVTLNLGLTTSQAVNANRTLTLNSSTGFEDATGGSAADSLTGNANANQLFGFGAGDTLNGGGGSDILLGGQGDDVYIFATATGSEADVITELPNEGTDTLNFSAMTTSVVVNLGSTSVQTVHTNRTLKLNSAVVIENVIGGTGADTLFGNGLHNTVTGGPGNDQLIGGGGNDVLRGGANNDSYIFVPASAAEADQVTENANEGVDTLTFAYLTTSVVVNLGSTSVQTVHTNRTLQLNSSSAFEGLTGGSGADTLFGNGADNTLTGNAGNDKLLGAGGNDLLYGGADNDTYMFVPTTVAEADTVSENLNQGIDTLNFGYLTTSVVVNLGSTAIQPVHLNRTLKLNSAVVFENLNGGSGADTLFGNTLSNTLTGSAGDDKLLGAGGSDLLLGGLNNDTYMFVPASAAEADQVTEKANEGIDTLNFAYLTTSVVVNLGSTSIQQVHTNRTLKLNSSSTFENAVGGTGSDTLLGNALANRLTGGEGNNILVGLEAGDILEAGSGRDILIGGLGLDILKGGTGDDILIAGRTTNDTSLTNLNTLRTQWISGNAYATRITNLRAGVGNPVVSLKAKINVLNDAGEDDVLYGGTGTDWFFRAVDDVIADLFAGELIDVL